ncbi:MAG: hypothetical protein LBI34_02085 [Puniceicoccales bacterium]|jgi:hypothetical protein|nr:hypothetical protein [Puniceicoccales bacterium]
MTGMGVVGSGSPYTLESGETEGVTDLTISVSNPSGQVTDEDVQQLETLLNDFFGINIDIPEAYHFQNQEELLAHAAGMLDAIDEVAVNLRLVSADNGNVIAEFNITDANMQNDQIDSTRTASASLRTMASIMQEMARVFAEIMATQSDTQALFALSSQQDIFNTFETNLRAAAKKVEAADKKLEADQKAATAKIIEGALQVAGSIISMGGVAKKPLEGLGQAVSAGGKIAGGAIDMDVAQLNHDATVLNIEAEKFQACAQLHQSMGSRMEQSASNMQQAINTMNQTLKSLFDAINQTTMTQAGNLR